MLFQGWRHCEKCVQDKCRAGEDLLQRGGGVLSAVQPVTC